MRGASIFGATFLCACAAPVAELPTDAVVSTSVCADSYLLALPDIEPRLAALSWQSRDALSTAPDYLRALPQADDDPERLRRWDGATIIGPELVWGEDFETVWTNFAALSVALDTPDPSAKFQSELDNLPKPATSPRLLYLNRAGGTAGPGTFVDAVMQAAGAENVITAPGWQSPDIETLIGLSPDAVITSFFGSDYAGVNDRALRHDALSTKLAELPRIDIPGALWPCAGPGLVEATKTLSNALAQL